MIDFARKPARQQAVPLNRIEVLIRRLCYLLAQKGEASKTTAVRSASGFCIKVNVSGKTLVSLTLQKIAR